MLWVLFFLLVVKFANILSVVARPFACYSYRRNRSLKLLILPDVPHFPVLLPLFVSQGAQMLTEVSAKVSCAFTL